MYYDVCNSTDRGYDVPTSAIKGFLAKGFSLDQYELLAGSIAIPDGGPGALLISGAKQAGLRATPARIKAALMNAGLGDYPLVLHGASSVPKDIAQKINKYGGDLGEETAGVPEADIEVARRTGCTKVNIDTDLRMASTGAIRKFLAENTKEFDPRKYFTAATKAMKGICKARYEAFGTAGNASAPVEVTMRRSSTVTPASPRSLSS